MKRRGGEDNCRASVEADASVDVFLVIFHFLSGDCFGRPMFHAFDGSFPFLFLLLLFFHYNGCIPSVEFLFFCLHFFAIPTVVVRSWEGRATCVAFFGNTEQGWCVEGGFFWVYCWAQVCRIGGDQVLISWEI